MRKTSLVFLILLSCQYIGSIEARYNDPWDKISRWKTRQIQGRECVKAIKDLSEKLSKTQSCNKWVELWTSNIDCAVKNLMEYGSITYCFVYKKDKAGLERFKKMLLEKYENKECIVDEVGEGYPTKCKDVISKTNIKPRHDTRPTLKSPPLLIRYVYTALKTRDIKGILKYIDSNTVIYGPDSDAPFSRFNKKFLKEYLPKEFTHLYVGSVEDDVAFPRRKGDPVFPCIASGSWGKWPNLVFRVYDMPLQINEPTQYYVTIQYGGCEKRSE